MTNTIKINLILFASLLLLVPFVSFAQANNAWEDCSDGSNIAHIGKCVSEEAVEHEEGRKGLNAVNVKVTKRAGDPIPDIDITIDRSDRGADPIIIIHKKRLTDTPNGDKVMRILKKKLPGIIN